MRRPFSAKDWMNLRVRSRSRWANCGPNPRPRSRLSADILDYYANCGEKFLAPKKLDVQEGEAFVESEPVGIVFCVEPWNFPYYQLARVVGPSFSLGNVVMVKHASNVPQCAEAFEKLFREAGAPAGVYTNLFVTKDQIARLISDFRIKAVALTGSEAAGSVVAAQAGKSLKKSTLELGGSDAFIVLEDADIDRAVAWAVWGRMNNTGQCCVASKRFIVVEEVADQFLDRFKASLQQLKPGDPMDAATTLGPLSSEGALRELLQQVETAVAKGATLALGGKRLDRPGAFIEAGILTDVTPDNPAYYQEFFGPVALFFCVRDEAQAVAVANNSPFGLGGSVFTTNIERGKNVARRINTGMVFINQATWTAPELPFGGNQQLWIRAGTFRPWTTGIREQEIDSRQRFSAPAGISGGLIYQRRSSAFDRKGSVDRTTGGMISL